MTAHAYRLQIVGSGAIGSLLAAGAEKHGVPYGMAPRGESQPPIRVESADNGTVALANNNGRLRVLGAEDILVLPLKVYQLAAALEEWQPALSPDTPVILLHNGMGGLEITRRYLPEQPVLVATTSHGALKQADGNVSHTGTGQTLIGAAWDKPDCAVSSGKAITETLQRCLPPVYWQTDMLTALWRKLSVNAVINPLTAIHRVNNGALLAPQFQPSIEHICQETRQVMAACGVEISGQAILEHVYQVIELTAANYSSMHQDVAHHRPTEIDAINGYLVHQAQKKGIEVPLNTLLVEQVKALG